MVGRSIFTRLGRLVDAVVPPTMLIVDEEAVRTGWRADEAGEYCARCGVTGVYAALTVTGCAHCRSERVPWHGVWRLGAYEDGLRDWILQFKFQRGWAWADWFGRRLAEQTPDFENAVVTPVPLHWRRRLRRGYDQSWLTARAFAQQKGLKATKLLRRVRHTRPQSSISSPHERRQNVHRAFRGKNVDLKGMTVWLIDDVKTTGQTARMCVRALRMMGAERVNLVVTAVTNPSDVLTVKSKSG